MNQEARRKVLNRLRRAQGQLAAVVKAVEEGRPCPEVATQLAATSKALDRAGVALVSSAMQECVAGADSADEDAMTPADFERLLMMFA
jgi:DNA-binding FrmR family transcriptional regulator